MKKVLFIGLAATALLTACSNDTEVASPAKNAISFDGFVNKSTRATDLTVDELKTKGFGVYGYMDNGHGGILTNEKVSYASDWTYSNLAYWTADKDYWFFAFAPYSGESLYKPFTPNNADDLSEGGKIIFQNGLGNNDLIFAQATAHCTTPSTMDRVPFTFNHLLSRVKFQFKNGLNNENASIEVSLVTVKNATSKAEYNTKDGKWTATADATNGDLPFGSAQIDGGVSILKTKAGETEHHYMFPDNKQYQVTFHVVWKNGTVLAGEWDHTVFLPKTLMESGKSYMFTAELTSDNINPDDELYPILFTVEQINDWADFTEVPSQIPNTTPEP